MVMIEEPRDAAEARRLLTVTEGGHLTLFPLHTDGHGRAVDRLGILGVKRDELLAPGILNLLVNQHYLKRLCPRCSLSTKDALKVDNSGEIAKACRFVTDTLKRSDEGLLWQSQEGCKFCTHLRTPHWRTNNDVDSVLAATMFRPDDEWCDLTLRGNDIAAYKYFRSFSDGDLVSTDMRGKSLFEHGLKLAFECKIDIRECENIGSFERY